MTTKPVSFACPVCGSVDVFYSCEPKCCFNHVCSDCGATFEPVTKAVAGTVRDIEPPVPAPDSTGPTVACARCESIEVYALDNGRLVCAKCGQLLELEMTEISAAG